MPPDDLARRQARLLEARAAYVLRNEVVDSVLTVHPMLRAVHGAAQASPVERDLLPAVARRDAAAGQVARAAAARRAVRDEGVAAAVERRQRTQANAQRAAQVRALAAAAAAADAAANEPLPSAGVDGAAAGAAADAAAARELGQLRAAVQQSRQRWRLIKGTASAIVAGSGVDWAREAALCAMVLDPA